MKMRNATCLGTQTSKVPTRVTLLFINYAVACIKAVFYWAEFSARSAIFLCLFSLVLPSELNTTSEVVFSSLVPPESSETNPPIGKQP